MVILVMYVRKTLNHMRRALPVQVEVTVGNVSSWYNIVNLLISICNSPSGRNNKYYIIDYAVVTARDK